MTNRKLKIAMIEPIGGHGGMEFYDLNLCEAITLQGHEVVLYTSDNTTLDRILDNKFSVAKMYHGVFGVQSRWLRGLRYLRSTLTVLAHCKHRKASIAHFHIFALSPLTLIELVLFRIMGMKIVATVHDIEVPDQLSHSGRPNLVSNLLPFVADRFVVHSCFSRSELEQILPKAVSKITLVTHSDMDFVYRFSGSKHEARCKIGLELPKDAKVILFFGQIKVTKGLDLLLNAFSKLKYTQNIYLLVAGRAWRTEFERYVEQVNDLGVADRVILRHEYILNENVPAYFVASDFIVLPYRKIYNSGVVLRAMHYETPVICSNLPSFVELICDRETGLLFKADDEQSLVECIEYALQCPNDLDRISRNAKNLIAEKYSFDAVGCEMNALYESL